MLKLTFNPQRFLRISYYLLLGFTSLGLMFYLILLSQESPTAFPKTERVELVPRIVTFEQALFKPLFSSPKILDFLQHEILFFGTNDRPDSSSPLLFFGVHGSSQMISIKEGKEFFLSPKELEISTHTNSKSIRLSPTCIDGNCKVLASFGDLSRQFIFQKSALPERTSLEFERLRLDSSILARQRAKWIGEDLFIARHGEQQMPKERIDFDEKSLWLSEESTLIWKEGEWQLCTPSSATIAYPMLKVDRIEDKAMYLTLWAPNLPLSINLILPKIQEFAPPPTLASNMHYLGTKSWTQWLFELYGEKVTVRRGDWWLCTDRKWHCINNEDEIDDYVDRKTVGELLVIDEVKQSDDGQLLLCHLFSQSRTRVWDLEIPLRRSTASQNQAQDATTQEIAAYYSKRMS